MTSSDWDANKLGGSVKRNIVNPDMIEEREKCNFDKTEFAHFVLGKDTVDDIDLIYREIGKNPELTVGLDFYELDRNEKMMRLWQITNAVFKHPVLGKRFIKENSKYKNLGFTWHYLFPAISVINLH
jgi:hypothetical protein